MEEAQVARPLLERDAELAEIARALEAAAAGSGSVVLIEGAAGIGKTRLLQTTVHRARELGSLALAAHGSELEQGFAFGTTAQLFGPVFEAADRRERRGLLSGAARLAAPALLLEGDVDGSAERAALAKASDPTFPIVHGLYWLTANLCERSPLLLALDDAHWADVSTLRFLSFLASRAGELPLVAALSLRPAEGEAQGEVLLQLLADPRSRVLHPNALSAAATAELVRAALDRDLPEEFCQAAHEATGGNPFLLTELAAEVQASGAAATARDARAVRDLAPRSVARSVSVRLARLAPGATALARAVAVLGDDTPVSRAAKLAGLEREVAGELADELGRHDVLRPGLPLRFRHPLVRAAIYSGLQPAERAAHHAQAAGLLLEENAPAEQVATHLLEADPPFGPEAIDVLRRAASVALARGAADVARRYLRRALAEPLLDAMRPAVVGELGAAELLAGDSRATEHLREAYEAAASADERVELASLLAQAMFWAGRPAEGAALLEEAIAAARPDQPDASVRLESELIAMGYLDKSLLHTIMRRAEGLRRRKLGDSTPAERGLLAALAVTIACRGESASACRGLAGRALAGGRLLADLTADSPVYWSLALSLVYSEDFQRANEHIEAGLAAARSSGSVHAFAMGSSIATVLALRQGEVIESIAHAESCLEAARLHRFLATLPTALAYLVDALVRRGELDRAAQLLAEQGFQDGELPDTALFPMLVLNRGRLRMARGELEPALDDLLDVERRKYAWEFQNPCAHPSGSMAAGVLAQLGDSTRAIELAEKDLALARQWGTPGAIGAAFRALGVASGGDAGIEILRRAVSELERSPLRLELAYALVDLGAALRRTNRRAESREPLRRGHELAQEFGTLPLVERAQDELAAAGARPRTVARTGIEQLTPSERRVARMAAEGMSNPEIAAALFLTTKTIETHLSKAYRKLGISSRWKLSAALAAEPLETDRREVLPDLDSERS